MPIAHTCTFNGAGERFRHQPWDVFGGAPGASGRFMLVTAAGESRVLEVKPAGVAVGPGDKLVIETPGAGGSGRPSRRSPWRIAEGRRSAKFSEAYLEAHYGAKAEAE